MDSDSFWDGDGETVGVALGAADGWAGVDVAFGVPGGAGELCGEVRSISGISSSGSSSISGFSSGFWRSTRTFGASSLARQICSYDKS